MKTGLDDYLMDGHTVEDLWALVTSEPPGGEWGSDPIPLTEEVPLPRFPVDCLPPEVAEMVSGIAEATQTDPAMAATSALTALSACVAGRVEIDVREQWREVLVIQALTIADSGERKSSVQGPMVKPLLDAETHNADIVAASRRAAEIRKQIADKRAESLRHDAAKAEEDRVTAADRAIAAAEEAEAIQVPVIPRFVADDITPEAAGSLVADQGGRLAIMSTEGGIFDIIAGRYSKGNPNLDLWLKGHCGDVYRLDRKGRPPEYVPRTTIVVGLMIQPAVLEWIAANPNFRGRGLLARFLYARPVSKVGRRTLGSPTPETAVRAYRKLVFDLADKLFNRTETAILTVTPAAREVIERIERNVEPTLVGDGELAQLADWGKKYAGTVARLAGILHMAEYGADDGPKKPVERKTAEAAATIGEYFKAAAINCFAEMGANRVLSDAVYLKNRLTQLGVEEITEREMMRAARRFHTKADLHAPLAMLIEYGWLLEIPPRWSSHKGRPSPRYKVRPT